MARGGELDPTEPASVVVALVAEGLQGGRAGAGRPGGGAAGGATAGAAPAARPPHPAERGATPTARRAGLRGLGPALGVVLPRLAAAVGRHVEQAEGARGAAARPAARAARGRRGS